MTGSRRQRCLPMALLLLLLPGAVQAGDWDAIAQSLVLPTERHFSAYRWSRPPDVIAVYFGAAWCSYCHAFLPHLLHAHARLKASGANTEVVFFSLDQSQRDMHRYMRNEQMPWPAIDYRRRPSLPALQALGGPAPPGLVILSRDGQVLANAWQSRHYPGPYAALDAWLAGFGASRTPLDARQPMQ